MEYIELLGNIRIGRNLEATINAFNSQCLGNHKRDVVPVILAATNSVADQYNARGLQALTSDPITYDGVVTGEFNIDTDKLPSPETLTLKAGAHYDGQERQR